MLHKALTNFILFALLSTAAPEVLAGEPDADHRELHERFYQWGGPRVPVCKKRSNGKFVWKSVNQNRVSHFVANGGGFPGDAVPGQAGSTFGEYCAVVPPVDSSRTSTV